MGGCVENNNLSGSLSLPVTGSGFFEPCSLPNPARALDVPAFRTGIMRCCRGLPLSAPRWGHVPGDVRRLEVVQARPDIRVRIRSIVIRIRVRHAAIRIRVVVAAIDHTAY